MNVFVFVVIFACVLAFCMFLTYLMVRFLKGRYKKVNKFKNIRQTGSNNTIGFGGVNISGGGKTTITGVKSGRMNINGSDVSGRSFIIDGDVIISDGVEVSGITMGRNLTIKVDGDCEDIRTTSGDVNISGSCQNIGSTSGDITVSKNVTGWVKTTSGDVDVGGDVGGSVSTVSGDINY